MGTRWSLYTLTGRQSSHVTVTVMMGSREKAVITGWDTVRKGDAATGGVLAAMVSDSEHRVVWVSLFDPAEYDAAVVEVPDNLVDIPAGGEAHQAWADRWALFVAAEIERRTVRA